MPIASISSLLGLVLVVLLACVALWATRQLLSVWSIGDPWATTIFVVIVVLVASWVLRLFWWPGLL